VPSKNRTVKSSFHLHNRPILGRAAGRRAREVARAWTPDSLWLGPAREAVPLPAHLHLERLLVGLGRPPRGSAQPVDPGAAYPLDWASDPRRRGQLAQQ
jgi:hypothetical protein